MERSVNAFITRRGLRRVPAVLPPPFAEARVHSDAARCVQCGVCGYNCPVGILVRDYARHGQVVTDPSCIQCGQCINVCPRGTLRWGHTPLRATAGPTVTREPPAGTKRYLIIGNGAAGASAAEEIRARDPRGEITIVSAERHPMYSRPGLAYVVTKEIPANQTMARPTSWYTRHKIKLVYGRAVKFDPASRSVHLANHPPLPYDRLLIATGARAAALPYPGGTLDGVVYLDTLDGTRELLHKMGRARRVVVVGGGITALEMAEGFAHNRVETHYLVRRSTLWSSVLNETESQLLDEQMRKHGVQIHYNAEIAEVLGNRRRQVTGVKLESGEVLPCNLVGAGIGVKAQLEWIQDTPLKTDRGVLVNEYLESSVPDVYVAGDCAQAWDPWTRKHMLDVLWPTAVAQGQVAGANMAGAHSAYAKGTPFNACLLFGWHMTAMGQIGGGRADEGEIVQHTLSRGSSEIWASRPASYMSAWSHEGGNVVRLLLDGQRLAGALVIGEQSLADPLRDLINWQTDIAPLRPALVAGGADMPVQIRKFWLQARAGAQPGQGGQA
jgi:NADPH-dependent 2,4-dienoyl-CoA reductase/sulfur reductase-like enzyme/ferredoxin